MAGLSDLFTGVLGCSCMAFMIAIFFAVMGVGLRKSENWWEQIKLARRPLVEVEADILARFEAGEIYGSEQAKARQSTLATWDPYELELRYIFDGREIVSRGQVPADVFFRVRAMKTLKIQVDPDRPVIWVPLGKSA